MLPGKSWNFKLKLSKTWVMKSHAKVMGFKTVIGILYQFQIILDTLSLNGIIYKINYTNNNTVLYSSKLYNKI